MSIYHDLSAFSNFVRADFFIPSGETVLIAVILRFYEKVGEQIYEL